MGVTGNSGPKEVGARRTSEKAAIVHGLSEGITLYSKK